jgi:hypothetical protein
VQLITLLRFQRFLSHLCDPRKCEQIVISACIRCNPYRMYPKYTLLSPSTSLFRLANSSLKLEMVRNAPADYGLPHRRSALVRRWAAAGLLPPASPSPPGQPYRERREPHLQSPGSCVRSPPARLGSRQFNRTRSGRQPSQAATDVALPSTSSIR